MFRTLLVVFTGPRVHRDVKRCGNMFGFHMEHSNHQGLDLNIYKSDSISETTNVPNEKLLKLQKRDERTTTRMEYHEASCIGKQGEKRKPLEDLADYTKHRILSDFDSEKSDNTVFKRVCVESDSWEGDSGFCSENSPPTSGRSSPNAGIDHCRLVALDCEMVGTGPGGRWNEVARCSIVDYVGNVIYDKYILPQRPVTDYRTRWSGIRKHHLADAVPFKQAQTEIISLLRGKIVVGHALFNDFEVLDISVVPHMIRDTLSCRWLQELYHPSGTCKASLKKLALRLLNRTIQVGKKGHCSIEDALAALHLYKLVEDQWEKDFLSIPLDSNTDHCSKPQALEHFLQDQYWQ
ncbi:hypothetical protein DNTS_034181 [Danionella cerebrum]|uniref:Exonuclease domain-containing protein n=1 Tax=Danionella cerebrum TaxID=2873325 RepID=A0A553N1F0_9TELE|nr:hypothetical protein DNTS_034181 [Danionella translucida]